MILFFLSFDIIYNKIYTGSGRLLLTLLYNKAQTSNITSMHFDSIVGFTWEQAIGDFEIAINTIGFAVDIKPEKQRNVTYSTL